LAPATYRKRNMHLAQSTWSVFTITLKLDLIYVIGFRTILTAVLLRGWNLTLALLVSAFVPALYIRDVIHSPPPKFEFFRSVFRVTNRYRRRCESVERTRTGLSATGDLIG